MPATGIIYIYILYTQLYLLLLRYISYLHLYVQYYTHHASMVLCFLVFMLSRFIHIYIHISQYSQYLTYTILLLSHTKNQYLFITHSLSECSTYVISIVVSPSLSPFIPYHTTQQP